MDVTIDKVRSGVGSVAALLVAVLAAELPLVGQTSDRTNAVIPLIVMDNVPLSDAIANTFCCALGLRGFVKRFGWC